jgi:hypothetical protein
MQHVLPDARAVAPTQGQYIYKIMPIKAKNFYGYHPAEGIFLKVRASRSACQCVYVWVLTV